MSNGTQKQERRGLQEKDEEARELSLSIIEKLIEVDQNMTSWGES